MWLLTAGAHHSNALSSLLLLLPFYQIYMPFFFFFFFLHLCICTSIFIHVSHLHLLMAFFSLDFFPSYTHLFFLSSLHLQSDMSSLHYSGAIKSWLLMVNQRCSAHGTEMTWLRKWSSPWPQRAWGQSALDTEIFQLLMGSLTGTMKTISSLGWHASVWLASKILLDQRLVATHGGANCIVLLEKCHAQKKKCCMCQIISTSCFFAFCVCAYAKIKKESIYVHYINYT